MFCVVVRVTKIIQRLGNIIVKEIKEKNEVAGLSGESQWILKSKVGVRTM